MDAYALAGLIKRIYPSFSMDSFDNRLKLQKIVFLMRSAGIDIGYSYSLYLRGPYSPGLTRDAFIIQDWDVIQEIRFSSPEHETNFVGFLRKIEPHKNDSRWLEVASTLLLIKELRGNDSEDLLVKEVAELKKPITEQQVSAVYASLREEGWFS